MKDFIVNSLDLLCKIGFVLFLLAGFMGGAGSGHPFGAVAGLVVAFILGVVFFGGLFVILEINENLRAIRKALEQPEARKQ